MKFKFEIHISLFQGLTYLIVIFLLRYYNILTYINL